MGLNDLNPYSPPPSNSEAPVTQPVVADSVWIPRLLGLQILVISVSLIVEAFEHETIVGSGPIFAIVGIIIAVVAFRRRDLPVVMFGSSAVALSVLVVFLINYNRWSPAQGDAPITRLAIIYTVLAIPAGCWLLVQRRKRIGVESDTADFADESS